MVQYILTDLFQAFHPFPKYTSLQNNYLTIALTDRSKTKILIGQPNKDNSAHKQKISAIYTAPKRTM